MTDEVSQHWEERYREREQIWSGRPNQALVDEVVDLPAGRALDLGCGEGGDSAWLAERGWRVTAVDVSPTAIERARAHAPSDRITWVRADLASWTPDESYDLVSACFLHSRIAFPRTEVLRRAAATIGRGGHLLIVGHAEPPPWSQHHQHDDERLLLTPEQEVEELALPESEWETVRAEVRTRDAVGPDGERATLQDAVTLLRRR